jgi:hypothetical protein
MAEKKQTTVERPEWLRPKMVPLYFGIGRSRLYELINEGKVKSVSLRERGAKHGTRLVSYDSLSNYIESMAGNSEVNGQSPADET